MIEGRQKNTLRSGVVFLAATCGYVVGLRKTFNAKSKFKLHQLR
jgi:hypothetical protein